MFSQNDSKKNSNDSDESSRQSTSTFLSDISAFFVMMDKAPPLVKPEKRALPSKPIVANTPIWAGADGSSTSFDDKNKGPGR